MEIRTIARDELEAYARASAVAFGQVFDPARAEAVFPTVELDRSLAAFEGPRIVGTAHSSGFSLTVPGGTQPFAAVQGVTVQPTHRRRGILTTLMRRQLDDFHERGDVLAGLWATETPIYRRFGYGPATASLSWEADRRDILIAGHAPEARTTAEGGDLEVALLSTDAARKDMEAVYEALRPRVPGMVDRPEVWWDRYLRDPEEKVLRVVVSSSEGPVAYASYRVEASWGYRGPDNRLTVSELLALSPTAASALWRYLWGIDLVATMSVFNRPPDDPLEWMVTDPRALRRRVSDALWLRLVDVGAAMAARGWSAEVGLRVGVRDGFCPWNEGTWSIDTGPEGASVERATGAADLTMDAASLASVYLGGHRVTTLLGAGLVEEITPGAALALDRALLGPRAPWAVSFF